MKSLAKIFLISVMSSLCLTSNGKVVDSAPYICYGDPYVYYPNGVLDDDVETPAYRIEKNDKGIYPPQFEEVAILCGESQCVNCIWEMPSDFQIPFFIEFEGKIVPVAGIERVYAGSDIENVAMPDGLSYIGFYTFCDMKNAKSLTIPSNLRKLGTSVFIDNNELDAIYFRGLFPPTCEVLTMSGEEIELEAGDTDPEDVRESSYPFDNTWATLYVPTGTRDLYVNHPCFRKGVIFEYDPQYKKGQLGEGAYPNLSYIKIGDFDVAVTGGNTNFGIPAEVPSGEYILGVDINTTPYRVRAVAPKAYKRHGTLKEITLPEGLHTICQEAFATSGLVTIDLPTTVKLIGTQAFGDLKDLERVIVRRSAEEGGFNYVARDAFADMPEDVELYIDKSLDLINLEKAPWDKFKVVKDISELSE